MANDATTMVPQESADLKMYSKLIRDYLDDPVLDLLVRFLEIMLSKISPGDWWKKSVVANLTTLQWEEVRRENISNLDGLDLAALLLILDKNWDKIWREISSQNSFTPEEGVGFVKEMQSVRFRWTHKRRASYPMDVVYRDLDTTQRFLKLINAKQDLIDELQKVKKGVLAILASESQGPVPKNVDAKPKALEPESKVAPGRPDPQAEMVPKPKPNARSPAEEKSLAEVKRNGMALLDVPDKLRTEELCLEAVKQNGMVLQFLHIKLKTVEVCLEAVKSRGTALKYVPINLRTEEICRIALNNREGDIYSYVPKHLEWLLER